MSISFVVKDWLFFCLNDFEVDLHTHAHLWSVNYEIINLNLKSERLGNCHFYYHQITKLIYFLSSGITIVASSKKNNIYRVRRINTNIQRERERKNIMEFLSFYVRSNKWMKAACWRLVITTQILSFLLTNWILHTTKNYSDINPTIYQALCLLHYSIKVFYSLHFFFFLK